MPKMTHLQLFYLLRGKLISARLVIMLRVSGSARRMRHFYI